jgi:hypothetical protein
MFRNLPEAVLNSMPAHVKAQLDLPDSILVRRGVFSKSMGWSKGKMPGDIAENAAFAGFRLDSEL